MSRLQLPPIPSTIPVLTTEQSRALNKRLPSVKRTVEDCVTCRGEKWFLWRDAQGNSAEFDCPCVDQFMLHRYLAHCGVPKNFQRLGWKDFDHLPPDVAETVMDYFAHLDAYVGAGFGLVITGPKGNGKTLLGYLVIKDLIARGVKCYCTTYSDMVASFMSTFSDDAQQRWFNTRIRNAEVLFIDDLGREYKPDQRNQPHGQARQDNRPGALRETLLEGTIRHRVSNSLPFVLTTNLTQDEMLGGYGGHTASLMAERSIFISVSGSDRRPEMRTRDTDLLKAGLTRPVVLS